MHVGYGAIAREEGGVSEEDDDDDEGDEDVTGDGCWRGLRRMARRMKNTWVDPKAGVVRGLVDVWWTRWGVLVLLPACLVSFSFDAWRERGRKRNERKREREGKRGDADEDFV